jgi:sulfur relay protein TusB/DsrH
MDTCISILTPDDAILFIEDGVYCCIDDNSIKGAVPGFKFYAQLEDLQARGLVGKIRSDIKSVNYDEFVQLCCAHKKVVSWF